MKHHLLLAFFALSLPLMAQDKPKWDVNNPPGKYKEISINTDEGTWMNVDVSPDGSEIAFDLLGDIYTMPISGGQAKAIRTGLAWEVQPRWSPDGKKILFTSDSAGGDNIFIWIRMARMSNKSQKRTLDCSIMLSGCQMDNT